MQCKYCGYIGYSVCKRCGKTERSCTCGNWIPICPKCNEQNLTINQ